MAPSNQKLIGDECAPIAADLFDKIICAVKTENEFKNTSHLLGFFVALLLISLSFLPFSFSFFMSQWKYFGTGYFVMTAFSNGTLFFKFWQDFLLSIFESLPIAGILFFLINVGFALFTVRLFMYKKGTLLTYLKHKVT
jgi:hypothetical protein